MQRTHSSNSKVLFFLKYFSTQRRKDAKRISLAPLRLCVGKLLAIALVATTFSSAQAQTNNEKPVQVPERVGVETADALPLSLNEAIRLALENNNDIRT